MHDAEDFQNRAIMAQSALMERYARCEIGINFLPRLAMAAANEWCISSEDRRALYDAILPAALAEVQGGEG